MTGLAYALALVTGLGLAQCLAGWILVARFAARVTTPPARFPPVTILKPLCGDEPLLEEALASCCCQTYPVFQIVFGVRTGPIRRLSSRSGCGIVFPNVTSRLSLTIHRTGRTARSQI